jgi:hypothetical protein
MTCTMFFIIPRNQPHGIVSHIDLCLSGIRYVDIFIADHRNPKSKLIHDALNEIKLTGVEEIVRRNRLNVVTDGLLLGLNGAEDLAFAEKRVVVHFADLNIGYHDYTPPANERRNGRNRTRTKPAVWVQTAV